MLTKIGLVGIMAIVHIIDRRMDTMSTAPPKKRTPAQVNLRIDELTLCLSLAIERIQGHKDCAAILAITHAPDTLVAAVTIWATCKAQRKPVTFGHLDTILTAYSRGGLTFDDRRMVCLVDDEAIW